MYLCTHEVAVEGLTTTRRSKEQRLRGPALKFITRCNFYAQLQHVFRPRLLFVTGSDLWKDGKFAINCRTRNSPRSRVFDCIRRFPCSVRRYFIDTQSYGKKFLAKYTSLSLSAVRKEIRFLSQPPSRLAGLPELACRSLPLTISRRRRLGGNGYRERIMRSSTEVDCAQKFPRDIDRGTFFDSDFRRFLFIALGLLSGKKKARRNLHTKLCLHSL